MAREAKIQLGRSAERKVVPKSWGSAEWGKDFYLSNTNSTLIPTAARDSVGTDAVLCTF